MINSTQSKNLIGYDLDGVICENSPKRDKPFFKQNSGERKAYASLRLKHCLTAKVLLKPQGDFIIITARKNKEEIEATKIWLKDNEINPLETHFLDGQKTRRNIIKFKSELVNSLGITEFYEDDPKICKSLTKLCKNTKIIQIK